MSTFSEDDISQFLSGTANQDLNQVMLESLQNEEQGQIARAIAEIQMFASFMREVDLSLLQSDDGEEQEEIRSVKDTMMTSNLTQDQIPESGTASEKLSNKMRDSLQDEPLGQIEEMETGSHCSNEKSQPFVLSHRSQSNWTWPLGTAASILLLFGGYQSYRAGFWHSRYMTTVESRFTEIQQRLERDRERAISELRDASAQLNIAMSQGKDQRQAQAQFVPASETEIRKPNLTMLEWVKEAENDGYSDGSFVAGFSYRFNDELVRLINSLPNEERKRICEAIKHHAQTSTPSITPR